MIWQRLARYLNEVGDIEPTPSKIETDFISIKEDIYTNDNTPQTNLPQDLPKIDGSSKVLSTEAEIQAVVTQTLDWCIQSIERGNLFLQEYVVILNMN